MTEHRAVEGGERAGHHAQGRAARRCPVVNLLPGVARSPAATLPDLTLHREGRRRSTRPTSRRTPRSAGSRTKDTAPLPYPHMLAFPLHMAIMTDASFPFPAIGTVHLENSITQHRPIASARQLDVTARAANLRAHAKGKVFDLRHRGPRSATSSCGSRRRRTSVVGKGDEDAGRRRHAFAAGPGRAASTWRLPGDLGRRYAAVSGDRNPIHLYPLTAKAFGLPAPDRARHVEQGPLRRGDREPAARRGPRRGGVQEADPPAHDRPLG